MRTKVNFNQQKQMLVSQIWRLFLEKGYEKCTVATILKEIGIPKGSFYHYFASKEECARECALYYTTQCREHMLEADDKTLTVLERFENYIKAGAKLAQESEIQLINSAPNQVFHQIVMAALVKQLAPLYAELFIEGTVSGELKVEMPLETSEMFLTLTNFYLDAQVFEWTEKEMMEKQQACIVFLSRLLGVEKDKLNKLMPMDGEF